MNTVVNADRELYAGPVPELKNKTIIDSGTRSNDEYSMELVTGSAVIDLLLNDAAFQKSWDTLYECCPWATVFQNRQFIAAWYTVYREQHLPILIKSVERGQLTGILPMVLLNASEEGKITAAGHYDAQYQTWLAAPSNGDAFIKKALAELMKQFPGVAISFRFLPPGTPLDWLKEDAKWRKCGIVQSYSRPLINFNNPEHAKLFQKKHFKHKLNRLKKSGEFRFETVTDIETFESSLHEMTILFDFRQSAMFNKNHFRDDPAKKAFLLKLFHLNLLHTTLMKVDGKIIAAVIAVTGKDGWVYLAGINCHSPFNSRFYSPGFMHFILLAKQLAEEGVQYFDLTPGYDAYKEELSNLHDEVHELVISSKTPFRIKKQIRKWVHTRLVAAGIRPMSTELTLKRYMYLIKHRSIMSVIKQLAKRLQKKRKQQLYSIQSSTNPSREKIALQKDNLNDLLQFEHGKRTGITRWEFMEDAMYRFDDKQHCFTCSENGRLLCCAWFSYRDDDNAIVLQHLYYHASAKDRVQNFLQSIIDVAVNEERSSIYFVSDLFQVGIRSMLVTDFNAIKI